MLLVEQLYDWLSTNPSSQCDEILAVALPRAEEPFFSRMAQVAARRATERSCATLVGCYDRLKPELRAQLGTDARRLRAGITAALQASEARVILNGTAALRDYPYPQVAFALIDALRKHDVEVSRSAGQALRHVVAEFLRQPETENTAEDRRQLARALREGLRSFDLHCRQEVLEACLWFAADLEDELWPALEERQSAMGDVVREQLERWNQPWLAGFLLRALRQPKWRASARALLQNWSSADHLRCLLRESDLLEDDEFRRALAALKAPPWFDGLGVWADQIPARWLARAPQWLCCLGFTLDERTRRLRDWLNLKQPALRKAIVYALATIETTEAVAALEKVAEEPGPLGTFAQWYITGRQAALTSVASGPAVEAVRANAEFTTLWQNLRRNTVDADRDLILAIRADLEAHRPQLRALLRSPDPRDRILVLRILSNAGVARSFATELRQLSTDAVEGIRHMAETVLRAIRSAPAAEAVGAGSEVAQ